MGNVVVVVVVVVVVAAGDNNTSALSKINAVVSDMVKRPSLSAVTVNPMEVKSASNTVVAFNKVANPPLVRHGNNLIKGAKFSVHNISRCK